MGIKEKLAPKGRNAATQDICEGFQESRKNNDGGSAACSHETASLGVMGHFPGPAREIVAQPGNTTMAGENLKRC